MPWYIWLKLAGLAGFVVDKFLFIMLNMIKVKEGLNIKPIECSPNDDARNADKVIEIS